MSHEWAKALVATLVLGILVFVGVKTSEWKEAATGQEDMTKLTDALFGSKDNAGHYHWGYLFPFEVLSITLLGALFAALYVGAKTKKEPGGGVH